MLLERFAITMPPNSRKNYAKNYNYKKTEAFLPEYGRHIHEMVDSLMQIEDRRERNRQARAVIAVMGNLNPLLRDTADFTHKLWDHLSSCPISSWMWTPPIRSLRARNLRRLRGVCPIRPDTSNTSITVNMSSG